MTSTPSRSFNMPPDNPKFGAIWFNEDNEMLAWDGSGWVSYEDLPPWPGADPDPLGVTRET
jgi:hypothetical protein